MFKKTVTLTLSAILIFCLYVSYKQPIFKGYATNFEISLCDYSLSQGLKVVDSTEFLFTNGIKGESCQIEISEFSLIDFLNEMNAKIVFEKQIDGAKSYYCYSNDIKYQKIVEGQIVNLQVVLKNEFVKVGSPIIYGSF